MCTLKFFSEPAGSVCTVEMMEKCALLLILAALVSSRSVFQPLEDKPITWDTHYSRSPGNYIYSKLLAMTKKRLLHLFL